MMKSLGVNWQEAKPTLLQYRSWLQDEMWKFSRTTVIIDALDELPTRDLHEQLIRELRQLQPPVHLLVTSRPIPEIRKFLAGESEIEIQPQKEDVILYVESRLKSGLGLQKHIDQNAALSDHLIEALTQANERMYGRPKLVWKLPS